MKTALPPLLQCRVKRAKSAGFFLVALLYILSPTFGWAAGIDLGAAGAYTVFGLGSTQSVGAADSLTVNSGQIFGDVAVGADTGSSTASGSGTFQKGFIQGSLFVDGATTPASYDIVNKNFTISGTVFGTVPANPGSNPDSVGTGTFDLTSAVQAAIDRSAFYAALPGQVALGNFSLNSANTTLLAGAYSATGFDVNSGSTLTISGGPTDTFVLNDSGGFNFAKSFIVLTGGITPANVLFNITGTGTTVTVTGNNSIFDGTVLAPNRSITVDAVPTFDGRVIGALSTSSTVLDLQVSSDAVITGVVPEPSTIALFGTGLTVLTLFLRFRRLS